MCGHWWSSGQVWRWIGLGGGLHYTRLHCQTVTTRVPPTTAVIHLRLIAITREIKHHSTEFRKKMLKIMNVKLYLKNIFLLRLVSTSRKSLLLYPKIPWDHSSLIIYLCRLKCRGIRFQSKQTIILITGVIHNHLSTSHSVCGFSCGKNFIDCT